ncbi:MAG: Crp/Fnr family transcriptional regulator [Candidatus Kapabacteria bacterium]|nr:Crp/Fnr family transcriptional regulator [Candidatus Kapabacteria bacterium]
MKNEININTFKQITGFTDNELEIVLKYFETKSIKKKTILLTAGKIADEVYFIVSGCIRLFCIKDGEDLSTYFFTEQMFAGSYSSFISRKPSQHSIETLEDCQVLSLSFKALEELYVVFPKMNEFIRKSIEERFVVVHDLFTSYILNSPEERYLSLQKERPELLNRIPQHLIASFLGITPVSLSRIRNRVAKKK